MEKMQHMEQIKQKATQDLSASMRRREVGRWATTHLGRADATLTADN